MGNRVTQTQSQLGSRYSEPNLSVGYGFGDPPTLRRRRSSFVRRYLQPPSSTLSEYLQAHSAQYHGFGPQFKEHPELSPYQNDSAKHRDVTRNETSSNHSSSLKMHSVHGTNSLLTNIVKRRERPEGKVNKWFHEMRNRKAFSSQDTENSIRGDMDEVEDFANAEREQSSSSTSEDDVAIRASSEEPSMKEGHQSQQCSSQYVSRTGDMRSSSTASRERGHFTNIQIKSHSCYSFNDPRTEDASDLSSRSTSGSRARTHSVRSLSARRDRFACGDLLEGSSVSLSRTKCEAPRSTSACTSASRERYAYSRCSKGSSQHQLGFRTQPDGTVTYTAFLRAGPCGTPVEGWLNELHKRVARHLIGLNRQFDCTVRFEPELILYRGSFVHALLISGPRESNLIRCRNALPACLEKYLITPFAQHGHTVRAH